MAHSLKRIVRHRCVNIVHCEQKNTNFGYVSNESTTIETHLLAMETVNSSITILLKEKLKSIEDKTNADVLVYFGPIIDGIEVPFAEIIESLKERGTGHSTLLIMLETNGGSIVAVERFVTIIRHHYSEVKFVVPDCAYSAGTIFCMSGDDIWMDYFSVLGPIDPQVPNKDRRYVPALGYLDKVRELIEKSRQGILTSAELIMLKDMDLAELRRYEQVSELTVTLLEKWLVTYKFKDWNKHKNGDPVTEKEKSDRAKSIAKELGDNKKWKAHGRPIDVKALRELKLKITDLSTQEARTDIREFHKLYRDYTRGQDPSFPKIFTV